LNTLSFSESLKKSWKGIILFLGSFVTLWWNEGRAVHQQKSLIIVEDQLIKVDTSNLKSDYSSPVHFAGITFQKRAMIDPEIDAPLDGIRFRKHVLKAITKENSVIWDALDERTYNTEVKISKINIGIELIDQLYNFEPLELPGIKNRFSFIDSNDVLRHGVFIGKGNYDNPQKGDRVVYYDFIPHGIYSVIGSIKFKRIGPFETGHYPIALIEKGNVSPTTMLENAHSSNTFSTWFLRATGISMMFYSLMLMFTLLLFITAGIPILNKIAHWSAKAIAGAFAGIFGSLIIGVAWLYYRPMVAIILFGTTLLIIYIFHRMSIKDVTPRQP